MRTSLSIKTLFRSPLKTIITFILLFASSFMLVYNVLDYALTNREFERSMERYHGVVSIERGEVTQNQEQWRPTFLLSDHTNPANYNNRYLYENYHVSNFAEEDIQAVMDIPQISATSPRYMTAGVSPDFMRTDVQRGEGALEDFFDYMGRFVIEAKIDKITRIPDNALYQPPFYTNVYMLTVSDIEPLAGSEEAIYTRGQTVVTGNEYHILVSIPNEKYYDNPDFRDYIALHSHNNARLLAWYSNNHFTQEMIDNITPGERYVIVGRADGQMVAFDGFTMEDYAHLEEYAFFTSLALGDDTIYDWWDYITPVSELPENYLESEECAQLRELIKITNDDWHTFDVVYSDDMSTIRRITENRMLLTDGRWLTPKDTENNAPVCVVSDTMLLELGLDIGDKMKLRLGDKLFEQYAPLGAVASTQGRYAENFTDEIEFEIVGAYADMGISKLRNDELYWAYNENTVFVPLSYLPVSEENLAEHEFKPGELSFVIENAADIRSFMEEEMPKLKEMGLTVYFSDNNWLNIEQHFNRSKLLTVSKLTAFAAAAALATLLTVYLFVWRKKKEFAIMRALGTTRGKARRSVYVPLFVLAAAAIILGGTTASVYAGKNAVKILSDFIKLGLEVDTSIPISSVLLGIGAEYVLLIAVTLIALVIIGRKPPLVLLQDSGSRKVGKKRKTAVLQSEVPQITFSALPKLEPMKAGGYSAARHTLSYISKSSRRNALKSILAIALAAILFGAMGQFTVLRQAYNELYQNIEIKPRFINGMPLSAAMSVAKSGYVHDPYYEYYFDGEANRKGGLERIPCDVIVGNDFERTLSADIEYMEGYDRKTIGEVRDRVCVVSDALLDELGLSLGDTIAINEYMYIELAMAVSASVTEEIATELYMNRMLKCTIVGRVISEKKSIGLPAAARQYFQSLMPAVNLDLAEYVLNDYHQVVEFSVYARDAADVRTGITRPIFVMDTSEADNIYMIYRLIETLYPIALIAAIVLGGGLPGLIILQGAREASILRVLGTTKKRTRLMLLLEQVFLCVIGLIIAFAVLSVINGSELAAVAVPIAVYCALHFIGCVVGTTVASVTVTKKKVLELLQTKE